MTAKPVSFTRDGARRVAQAVRKSEQGDSLFSGSKSLMQTPGDGAQVFINGLVSAVSGAALTELSVAEAYYDGDAGWKAIPGGRVWDGADGNLPKVIAIDGRPREAGQYVTLAHRLGPNDGSQWYVVPERFFFQVQVTKDGGADGVYNSQAPTYTYTVKDWATGNVLALAKSPFNNRDECPYTTATKGWAFIDNAGDLQLGFVNEEIDLPAAVGDNVGYWQLEANSPYGNGVTASELAAGKIEFKSRANAGEIPIYTEITNGAGTDDVLQYIKEADLPSSGADGQGFESVTDGVTTLNKTDGGIISFAEKSSPTAGHVAVTFDVIDNDPTATVEAEVDLTGITGDSGVLAGVSFLDIELRVEETTTLNDTQTLSNDDHRGRLLHVWLVSNSSVTDTIWENGTPQADGDQGIYIPRNASSDYTLVLAGGLDVFVDVSDGGKLKAVVTSVPSAGNYHPSRLIIMRGAAKASADFIFN